MAEQQELAKVFGEVAFKAIGDLAESQYEKAATKEEKAKWLAGGEYKIALHALIGGIMSDLGGSGYASGAVGAGVNQAIQGELSKITDTALRQWASAVIGATATELVGGNAQSGASTAASGIKNNDVGHPGKDLLAIEPTEKAGNYYQVDGKFYQVDADGNPQEISPDQAVGQRVWAVTEDGTTGWWTVDGEGKLNWAGATGERRYEDGQVWQIGTDGKDYAVQVSTQEEISLENQKIINENDDLLINALIARGGLELIGKASLFEKLISKLPAGERVALVKTQAANVAEQNGWVKDTKLSTMNSRDIYQDPNTGNLYSVDTQHGRFEMTNSKGKYLGEVNFDLTQTNQRINQDLTTLLQNK